MFSGCAAVKSGTENIPLMPSITQAVALINNKDGKVFWFFMNSPEKGFDPAIIIQKHVTYSMIEFGIK